MDFAGMPNAAGYNKSGDAKQAGWTLGFVSLGEDLSTRKYSESTVAGSFQDWRRLLRGSIIRGASP